MKVRSVVIILLGVSGDLCLTDDFQNLMEYSLYYPRSLHKISLKSVHSFLTNPADKQTERHTRTIAGKDITYKIGFGVGNINNSNRNDNNTVVMIIVMIMK